MIEIKQKNSGKVIVTIDADTLMNADLREMDLREADFSGMDLRGVHLDYSDLTGADLSHANLQRASLCGAHLDDADLQRITLTHARVGSNKRSTAAVLDGCNISGGDLSDSDLRHVSMRGADLSNTRLDRVDMSDMDATLADLSGSIANNSIMIHAWMPGANLSNAVYKDCHINAANLFAANLSGIVLESSHEEGFSAINLANLEEGLELAEQLGWELPDVIFYPTGGGTGLIGMWKVFDELEAIGWIGPKRPRMVAVQADGKIVVGGTSDNEFALVRYTSEIGRASCRERV